jgi:hypothetical protein
LVVTLKWLSKLARYSLDLRQQCRGVTMAADGPWSRRTHSGLPLLERDRHSEVSALTCHFHEELDQPRDGQNIWSKLAFAL